MRRDLSNEEVKFFIYGIFHSSFPGLSFGRINERVLKHITANILVHRNFIYDHVVSPEIRVSQKLKFLRSNTRVFTFLGEDYTHPAITCSKLTIKTVHQRARSLVVSDLRSETKFSRFKSCCYMPSPFSCSPVIRECLWKKTQVEKKSEICSMLTIMSG